MSTALTAKPAKAGAPFREWRLDGGEIEILESLDPDFDAVPEEGVEYPTTPTWSDASSSSGTLDRLWDKDPRAAAAATDAGATAPSPQQQPLQAGDVFKLLVQSRAAPPLRPPVQLQGGGWSPKRFGVPPKAPRAEVAGSFRAAPWASALGGNSPVSTLSYKGGSPNHSTPGSPAYQTPYEGSPSHPLGGSGLNPASILAPGPPGLSSSQRHLSSLAPQQQQHRDCGSPRNAAAGGYIGNSSSSGSGVHLGSRQSSTASLEDILGSSGIGYDDDCSVGSSAASMQRRGSFHEAAEATSCDGHEQEPDDCEGDAVCLNFEDVENMCGDMELDRVVLEGVHIVPLPSVRPTLVRNGSRNSSSSRSGFSGGAGVLGCDMPEHVVYALTFSDLPFPRLPGDDSVTKLFPQELQDAAAEGFAVAQRKKKGGRGRPGGQQSSSLMGTKLFPSYGSIMSQPSCAKDIMTEYITA